LHIAVVFRPSALAHLRAFRAYDYRQTLNYI
jgi:hypothetical protein